MKNILFASAILLGGLVTTAASAMPVVTVSKPVSNVEQVAWGCGRGFHPDQWGRCRPNRYGPPPGYWGPRHPARADYYRPHYGWRYEGHRDWHRDRGYGGYRY